MSYGQPCSRMTARPSAGPVSAYPTFKTPASICLSEPNDVLAPGLIVGKPPGLALFGCAAAETIMPNWVAASVMAAVPRKLRRCLLISSNAWTSSTVSLLGFTVMIRRCAKTRNESHSDVPVLGDISCRPSYTRGDHAAIAPSEEVLTSTYD